MFERKVQEILPANGVLLLPLSPREPGWASMLLINSYLYPTETKHQRKTDGVRSSTVTKKAKMMN